MMSMLIIVTLVLILLISFSTIPVFSQYYVGPPRSYLDRVYPWDVQTSENYDANQPIELDTYDLSFFVMNSTYLDYEWNKEYRYNQGGCLNDDDNVGEMDITNEMEEAQEEERLIMTYTDKKNNTVKIYCQYNPWLGEDTRLRQFTAFYNDKILVGLCPYDYAINRHEVHTNDEGEITRVYWMSMRTNGTDYVVFNTVLSQ